MILNCFAVENMVNGLFSSKTEETKQFQREGIPPLGGN